MGAVRHQAGDDAHQVEIEVAILQMTPTPVPIACFASSGIRIAADQI